MQADVLTARTRRALSKVEAEAARSLISAKKATRLFRFRSKPHFSAEKFDFVLLCYCTEVTSRAPSGTTTRCHRPDHLVDKRVEYAAWRRDHQLATSLRSKALDAMWRPTRSEKH